MHVHNCLKETRLEKGLTQESVAAMVRVTRQTIIAVEKEKFVPSVRLALELAQALGIPVGQLFWLEDPQEGEKS